MAFAMVTIHGVVGSAGELRRNGDGKEFYNFSVGVSKSKKLADGTWDNGHTTWFKCVASGKAAEALAKKVKKGMQVSLIGALEERLWQTKDGNEGRSLDVWVDKCVCFERAASASDDADSKAAKPAQMNNQEKAFDDDIPF